LYQAQSLAGRSGEINRIYVKASSSTQIQQVKKEIAAAYPKATVTTASDLASQVSGSLSSASNLATKLGSWLSLAALIAAVVIASLLTLSAVGRRTREFGTLKAIGWRSRRVVAQVMGESLVQGLMGGALGLALGVGGAALVEKFAPSLTASVSTTGAAGGGFPGPGGGTGGANPFIRTVDVALHAPIGLDLALLAIGLAVMGGVLAGAAGGWRASRLRPADAMRRIG
jgi:putative ABC transport system permease protein